MLALKRHWPRLVLSAGLMSFLVLAGCTSGSAGRFWSSFIDANLFKVSDDSWGDSDCNDGHPKQKHGLRKVP